MSTKESALSKCYKKKSHAKSADDGQGWTDTQVNDTLNAFDQGESRTPTLVLSEKRVYDWHRQDTRMTELKDICVTAAAGWGGGGNNMPYVLEEDAICLNDQGGSQMSVTVEKQRQSERKEHGHQPILLESNQNHATIQTDGISTALPASMGMGGGYVPMITEKETVKSVDTSHADDVVRYEDIVPCMQGRQSQGGEQYTSEYSSQEINAA